MKLDNSKKKKKNQLGMDPGTASHRLKKSILFDFTKRLDLNWCYQCGAEINNIDLFMRGPADSTNNNIDLSINGY